MSLPHAGPPPASASASPSPAPGNRRLYPGLDQLVLRSVVVLAALGCLVAVQAAGAVPEQWQQVVVLGLALLTAVRPDSLAGLGLSLWVTYLWAHSPAVLSPLALGCAAGRVTLHVAALVAAQGPARMAVDVPQVRRWARRTVILWLAAPAVWAAAPRFDDLPDGPWVQAGGLVLLILSAVVAVSRLRPEQRAG